MVLRTVTAAGRPSRPITEVIGRWGGSNISPSLHKRARALLGYTPGVPGVGVTAARSALRAEGFTFSNQAMTDMNREFRRIDSVSAGTRRLRGDGTVSRNTIINSGLNIGSRFRYHGQIEVFNQATNNWEQQSLSFDDNRQLTGTEIRDRFRSQGDQMVRTGQRLQGDSWFTARRDPVITGIFQNERFRDEIL